MVFGTRVVVAPPQVGGNLGVQPRLPPRGLMPRNNEQRDHLEQAVPDSHRGGFGADLADGQELLNFYEQDGVVLASTREQDAAVKFSVLQGYSQQQKHVAYEQSFRRPRLLPLQNLRWRS